MGALVASDGGAAVPVHPSARVAREADARGLALAVALVRADRDGDGHIEPKELARVMSDLGCPQTKERIAEIIQGVDTDGNGMIEFDEFIGIMATRMLKSDGAGEVEQAFGLFDDGSGCAPARRPSPPRPAPPPPARALRVLGCVCSAGPRARSSVPVSFIKEVLSERGSMRLSSSEIEQMMAFLTPDAEGRVKLSDFKALACWEVPLPDDAQSQARKRREDAAGPASG